MGYSIPSLFFNVLWMGKNDALFLHVLSHCILFLWATHGWMLESSLVVPGRNSVCFLCCIEQHTVNVCMVYECSVRKNYKVCVCTYCIYRYIYYTDVLNYCGHFKVKCNLSHFARPVAEASIEIGSKFLDPERGSRTITIEALQTSNSVLQAGIARLVCFTSISLGLFISLGLLAYIYI